MDYVAFIEKCGEVAQWVCPVIDGIMVGFIGWACIESVRDAINERKRCKRAHRRHQLWMQEYRSRNTWRYENDR